MGDARRLKKKYFGPRHPWQKERIEEEKELLRTYGLKNKKEIWKHNSRLKTFGNIAKRLIAETGAQAEKEQLQLFTKLRRLGLIGETAKLDDVLGLTTKDILERRLQTLVYRKGLARSMKQARQFITHGHIRIGERFMSVPSYLVSVNEEPDLRFFETSALSGADHPERQPIEKKEKKPRPVKKYHQRRRHRR